MIKPHKFIICLVIIFSSFFITNNSQAAVRPFIELFEQFFKFLGKRADDVPLPDAGKKLENFKGLGGKSDEVISPIEPGKKFTDQIENFKLNKVNEIKNSTDGNLLEVHGVKHADKISDAVDLSEIDISDFFEDNAAINTFRIFLWSGRVFRASNSFNKPDANRIVAECRDNKEVFYFTALLEKQKKWLLLSENINFENKRGKLNKQNLYVLTDIDEYIIFSTQTPKNKKFPLHFFIISKEGKFYHFNNVYGTESPEYIIANANKKINETKFTCKKV